MLRRFSSTLRQVSAGGLDPDALDYLTVSGNLGDTTIETAINNLVLNLKADSIWDKVVSLYPFAGGTDVKHSYNLKDPLLHQITWNGAVTHNVNGIQSTGGYGDTNTLGGDITQEGSASIYIRDNIDTNIFDYGSGTPSAPNTRFYFSANRSATLGNAAVIPAQTVATTTPNANTIGSHYMGRSSVGASSDIVFRKNNSAEVIVAVNSLNKGVPNIDIFICTQNNNGAQSGFSTRNYASLVLFNQYVPNSDILHNHIQTYQTELSRQV
jgi:hypothetical protein